MRWCLPQLLSIYRVFNWYKLSHTCTHKHRKDVKPRLKYSHSHAQAQRLAIRLTWIDFLCAWIAQWEGKKNYVSCPWVHIDIHSGSPQWEHKCHWKQPWYMLSFSPLPVAPSFFLCVSLTPSLFPLAGCTVPAAVGKKKKKKRKQPGWWSEWGRSRCSSFRLLISQRWNVKGVSSC